MPTLWLTYAHADNEQGDVDFLAQELERSGITVHLDRWTLDAGRRLWEQIESAISDPARSDAWVIFATSRSLASEACREELAFALDRALRQRSGAYPIIALLSGVVNFDLLPTVLRSRLCVSTDDTNWQERIVAAVEQRSSRILVPTIAPFSWRGYSLPETAPYPFAIEVRPRVGVWHPFVFAVPAADRAHLDFTIRSGPSNHLPALGGIVFECGSGLTPDGEWFYVLGYEAATPAHSYFAFFRHRPTTVAFGQANTPNMFHKAEGLLFTPTN